MVAAQFGSASVHDPTKPVHAGPEDGWHGVVAPRSRFAPDSGRYHLYIGYFCPFAHRVNLVRYLKGLDSAIDISVVKAYPKGENGWPGWAFPGANGPDDTYEGSTPDKLFGSKYLHEVYFRTDKDYKGKYSVPALWDTKENTLVNNESLEMLRWMQRGFDEILPERSPERKLTLYPEHLQAKIDEVGEWLTRDLNSGVYKAGFAKDQAAYEKGVIPVFAALNQLEQLIHKNGGPYVLGKAITELDVLAYATAIRFDVVYVQHFKCNLGTIRGNYPVIHEWLKNLYWNVWGFSETTNFKHIKENYTKSHHDINPLAITPLGPYPDVEEGVNLDFSSIKPGVIAHPAVLEQQKNLPAV
ncbi:glutathione S-transferase [Hypoxylon trugodes]|uniref:glutathione S-transferase n=1 Tax=Hypoxylon trugodes TaxID=326681 RepID=UPI00219390C4|nr:glutathione S-transferase [Hypoxylon trugodes]KAI1389020.1 glutathione S-transferase [Hypoxylon trugodes]